MGLLDTVEPPSKEYAILLPDKEICFNYKFLTDKEVEETPADGGDGGGDQGHSTSSTSALNENSNKYWEPWSLQLAASPPIPRDVMFNEIIVETVDTIRLDLSQTNIKLVHKQTIS